MQNLLKLMRYVKHKDSSADCAARLACFAVLALISCVVAVPVAAETEGGFLMFEKRNVIHRGADRSLYVFAPGMFSGSKALKPVVIVLHGGGGDGSNAQRMTGFTHLARREGFIAVYPNGSGRREDKLLTWNAGHCCGYAMRNKIDDVGFIAAVIEMMVRDYRGDPSRIYVTGLSNGGMMTHRLGVELSGKIAAIAPVISGLFGDEARPAHPVSALFINGALDESVPLAGGSGGGRFPKAWDGTPLKPGDFQGAFWAAANGCDATPALSEPSARVKTWRYACPEGLAVERVLVVDNGHAWPGGEKGSRRGDAPSDALDATETIWSFFKLHAKRRSLEGKD